VSLSLFVVLVLGLGVFAVYVLFVRPNFFSFWYAMKPGVLVTMAAESGQLQLHPFPKAVYWYEMGLNFHSYRWAATLLFLVLQNATGLNIVALSNGAFGILVFLLALLFVFVALGGARSNVSRWGILLAAPFVLNYTLLTWVYHSGGWPGTSLGLFIIGLLFASGNRHYRDSWTTLALILLILMLNWTYHNAAATLALFLWVLFAYSFFLQGLARLQRRPAVSPTRFYFSLASIALLAIYLDPLFASLVGTNLFRPWDGVKIFLRALLQGGDVVPYQVGYSLAGRLANVAPMASLMLVATWLWLGDHLLPLLLKKRPLREADVILGALYLAALTVPILSVVTYGFISWSQPVYLLIIVVPALLLAHVGRAERIGPGGFPAGAAAAALLLLVVAGWSQTALLRDPVRRFNEVRPTDTAVARVAAARIQVPYFADAFYTGLILMENHRVAIVPLEGDLRQLGGAIYSGPQGFVSELRARGAELAVLGDRNIAKPFPLGFRHSLLTPNFMLEPLPDYDLAVLGSAVVYENGESRVLVLPFR
jgi:hypothetical protein